MKPGRGILLTFILPALLVMFFIALLPFAIAIVMSFTNYNVMYSLEPQFIGFENYINIFTDIRALNALKNTFTFVFFSVAIEFCLALPLSYIIWNTLKNSKFENIMMILIAFPMLIPKVTSGLLWKFLYNPMFGPVNHILNFLGFKSIAFLSRPDLALPSIIFVDIWQWTPFLILIFLSALEALPTSPFEAAMIDGANEFQKFWKLAVPLLKPIFFVAIIFRVIDALRTFDTIYVMTGGGPGIATETVDIYAYLIGISQGGRIAYASSVSIILLIITIILSNLLVRFMYREESF
ncbi:carbohydrate ABC transporter permease [Petrotoga halophila]|jgi:multiple sugar transport system permease protein|uniref:ABC transmembrane type-1 domain-containing protein n=1 Tax=Petrotoga halophila DSM 16923 TaxID=1122953 RepID=A0A2S5E8T3_9BACT|nr:sugar ABC transporter permease [Petrotoga halophila]POZ89580.1 hypothetical protein AA81_13400 [Petrotoga halophila DSM 16923]